MSRPQVERFQLRLAAEHRVGGLAFFLLLALGVASPTWAIPIVDQNTGLSPNGGGGPAVISSQSVAQSLTVGLNGSLTQVDIQIYNSSGAIGDVTFELLSLTGGGLPDSSNSLFSTVIPITSVPVWVSSADGQVPWTSVDVSAAGLSFNTGDEFAVALSRSLGPSGPPWVIWVHHPDNYAGGNEFVVGNPTWFSNAPSDDSVRTWVEAAPIPEPSTLTLAAIALSCFAVCRFQRSRYLRGLTTPSPSQLHSRQ